MGFKITFDPWQEGAGRAILGKGKDRLYCADAVVMSIPRQVGKTFLIGAIVFALCVGQKNTLALWTAHRSKTAADTFKELKAFAQRPEIARHVRAVYDSANDMRIEFLNGSSLVFGARERGFGRGFKRVAIVVFDEAQILTSVGVDDMVPATNRHPNPLIIYIGTPPKPSDPGEHFSMLRREAIDGESGTTLYIEFSADRPPSDFRKLAAFVRDRVQMAKANPSFPKHTSLRAMLRMLKNLGVDSYLREAFGIWDEEASSKPFAPGSWAKLQIDDVEDYEPGPPVALGISADEDQVWLALGEVSEGESGGLHVRPGLRARADKSRQAFVDHVAALQDEHGCPVVIREKGPAGFLVDALVDAGVDVTLIGLDEVVKACADMRAKVATAEVEHANYADLNDAVDAAIWKKQGDRRIFAGDHIELLEAVTIATWGLGAAADVTVHGDDLDLCDRCGERPHEDPDGAHDYLCSTCREED